ncbi:hypothetical protein DFH28DRAFT_892547 [Melampsora americana]|nr:hypothetical protein DFH28DRAFT_892547 [Melampsora americana]
MPKSTHSTSTSKHQILSPSLSSNQHETQSNEEIELFKAIKASEDQFKLENQLNIQESNQIKKAIKISKNKALGQGVDRVNQPSRRLPPGAAYPTEKDYLVEDELLAIAIQLSIEENDHQDRIQTLEHQIPPPLPNRRERRQVPDIPLIPPPLPPRKKPIHHFNENRFHDFHHHFSDEFSDDLSLDSDDELNSFDDLSIHSSHYNPLDSTTNLINQRSFMNEENDDNRTNHHHSDSELHLSELHNLDQELRSFGERDESWIPTRKTSIQDSFVTAIDELDRNSRLESDSIHQARSSLLSERDGENESVYEDASIPNDLSGSTDTLHHLKVDENEFQTPNLSLGSSDTIRQVEVDDQPSEIPCGISDQSHSIQELGMNDQQSRSRNSLLDPSDIQQVEENDEECRTPKVDLSNPMNEIQEVENELNENSDNRNIEPLEDLMKSIQSIAKINYIKSQPEERNDLEIRDELEEIDVEKCDEVLNVSDKQSIWIETKTCSDLLKWLMWSV